MLDFFALTDPILQMQMSNTMKTGSTVGRMLMGACARLQVRKRRRRPLRPFHQHHGDVPLIVELGGTSVAG